MEKNEFENIKKRRRQEMERKKGAYMKLRMQINAIKSKLRKLFYFFKQKKINKIMLKMKKKNEK